MQKGEGYLQRDTMMMGGVGCACKGSLDFCPFIDTSWVALLIPFRLFPLRFMVVFQSGLIVKRGSRRMISEVWVLYAMDTGLCRDGWLIPN